MFGLSSKLSKNLIKHTLVRLATRLTFSETNILANPSYGPKFRDSLLVI